VDGAGRPAGPEHWYRLPAGRTACVQPGDRVEAGAPLTDGAIDPIDLLEAAGPGAVQDFLLTEVRGIYRHHGLEIDDRHFEVILAQMLRKVRVQTPGDTDLLPGQLVDRCALEAANGDVREWVTVTDPGDSSVAAGQRLRRGAVRQEGIRLEAEGKRVPASAPLAPATCRPHLLGLTRAAVQADSFIAAASFQRTVEVLAEAALAGRVDPLAGLKENVILGQRIPAGTGLPRLHDSQVQARPPRRVPAAEGAQTPHSEVS
jgi:DNA-directed RNA polymerase subunit beta'